MPRGRRRRAAGVFFLSAVPSRPTRRVGVAAAGAACDPAAIDGAALCCLNVLGEGRRLAPQALWAAGADHARPPAPRPVRRPRGPPPQVLRYESLGDDYAALARAYDLPDPDCLRRVPKASLAKREDVRVKGLSRGRRDRFTSEASRRTARDDLLQAHAERSTRHFATRLEPAAVPRDLRREADAIYAADFDLLGYLPF